MWYTDKKWVKSLTIKRGLSISNTLMIIIPILLFILFAAIMSLATIGVFGNWGGRSFDDNRFYNTKDELETLARNWDGNHLNNTN